MSLSIFSASLANVGAGHPASHLVLDGLVMIVGGTRPPVTVRCSADAGATQDAEEFSQAG